MLEGILVGVAYGVFLRGLVALSQHRSIVFSAHLDLIMTVAFLVGGPFVLGLLAVRRIGAHGPVPEWQWISVPWVATTLMMLMTALLNLEGSICIAMAFPIAIICSSLGGLAGGLLARHHRRLSSSSAVSLALLPVLLAPAESLHLAPTQLRTVDSQILIHAAPQTIWHNIERVPAITPTELRPTWTHRIGFPRPVEATLSHEGVGGVRNASFEHGLLFLETVTTWDPSHRLAFRIQADTAHIPPTTLDEHVTIGGRYFDVLDGEYRLEPLSDDSVLLHLTSHQRLSTDLNGYAGLWTDAIMQNLQTSILEVIQHRCEDTRSTLATAPSRSLP